MKACKLQTKTFINIFKTNLVWSRPKYGIFTMMIREPLIRPCLKPTMPLEWAYTWFKVGTAAKINEISNRRAPEKAQKVIEADADA